MKYDFYVFTDELIPPIGMNKWVAKAHVKKVGSPDTADVSTFPEVMGITEEEAKEKATRIAERWIAEQVE